jgi:hypothetical protein
MKNRGKEEKDLERLKSIQPSSPSQTRKQSLTSRSISKIREEVRAIVLELERKGAFEKYTSTQRDARFLDNILAKEILLLRIKGFNNTEIAHALSLNLDIVNALVDDALQAAADQMKNIREKILYQELYRLDAMQQELEKMKESIELKESYIGIKKMRPADLERFTVLRLKIMEKELEISERRLQLMQGRPNISITTTFHGVNPNQLLAIAIKTQYNEQGKEGKNALEDSQEREQVEGGEQDFWEDEGDARDEGTGTEATPSLVLPPEQRED